jgi:hypothetical protein
MLTDAIGRAIGFSFAAGINLYATVAILGLASRYNWVDLPPQYHVFENNWMIGTAVVLYVIEFVADKVPWVDSVWDLVHTIIRPVGGALIAVTSIGDTRPEVKALIAIAGAALASGSHFAKATTRVAANTSPEPFSNWILSLSEDGVVVALALLALAYPTTAAVVVLFGMALIVGAAVWMVRIVRRRLRRT